MKLVDGDNLLKAFVEARENYKAEGNNGLFININAVISIIKKAPAVDAVEVVRCKDCMFYNTSGHPDGLGWCETSRIYNVVRDDFYCGDGKKR